MPGVSGGGDTQSLEIIVMTEHTAGSDAAGYDLSWFEQTFVDYIRNNRLMLPRCAATGQCVPLTFRPAAPEDVDWVAATGSAVLYAFAHYHRQYSPCFPVPYHVVLVELAEGLRLISAVDMEDALLLEIGMPLRAVFAIPGRLSFVLQR